MNQPPSLQWKQKLESSRAQKQAQVASTKGTKQKRGGYSKNISDSDDDDVEFQEHKQILQTYMDDYKHKTGINLENPTNASHNPQSKPPSNDYDDVELQMEAMFADSNNDKPITKPTPRITRSTSGLTLDPETGMLIDPNPLIDPSTGRMPGDPLPIVEKQISLQPSKLLTNTMNSEMLDLTDSPQEKSNAQRILEQSLSKMGGGTTITRTSTINKAQGCNLNPVPINQYNNINNVGQNQFNGMPNNSANAGHLSNPNMAMTGITDTILNGTNNPALNNQRKRTEQLGMVNNQVVSPAHETNKRPRRGSKSKENTNGAPLQATYTSPQQNANFNTSSNAQWQGYNNSGLANASQQINNSQQPPVPQVGSQYPSTDHSKNNAEMDKMYNAIMKRLDSLEKENLNSPMSKARGRNNAKFQNAAENTALLLRINNLEENTTRIMLLMDRFKSLEEQLVGKKAEGGDGSTTEMNASDPEQGILKRISAVEDDCKAAKEQCKGLGIRAKSTILRIESLEEKLDEMNSKIENQSSGDNTDDIESMMHQIDGLQEQMSDSKVLQYRVDTLEKNAAEIKPLSERVDALENKEDETLKSRVLSLEDNLKDTKNFTKTTMARVDSLEQKSSATMDLIHQTLNQSNDIIVDKLKESSNDTKAMANRIDSLEKSIIKDVTKVTKDTMKQAHSIQEELKETKGRLETLEKNETLKEIKNQIGVIEKKVQLNEEKMDQNSNEIKKDIDRISGLEEFNKSAKDQFSNLHALSKNSLSRFMSLDQKMATVKGMLQNVRATNLCSNTNSLQNCTVSSLTMETDSSQDVNDMSNRESYRISNSIIHLIFADVMSKISNGKDVEIGSLQENIVNNSLEKVEKQDGWDECLKKLSNDYTHEYGIDSLEKFSASMKDLSKRISALEGGIVGGTESPQGKNSEKGTPNRTKSMEEQAAAIKGLGIRTKVLMARLDSFEERLVNNSNARVPSKILSENKTNAFSNSKSKDSPKASSKPSKTNDDDVEIIIDDDPVEETKIKTTTENSSSVVKSGTPPAAATPSGNEAKKPVKISLMKMKKSAPSSTPVTLTPQGKRTESVASDVDTDSPTSNGHGKIRIKNLDKLVGGSQVDKTNNNVDSDVDSDRGSNDSGSVERRQENVPQPKKYQKFFTSKAGGPRHNFFK